MDNLLTRLSDLAEWADANEYEVPINLGDTLREAAEEIKRLTASGTRWMPVCTDKRCEADTNREAAP